MALVGSEPTLEPYSAETATLHTVSKDSKAVKCCREALCENQVVWTQLEGYGAVVADGDDESKQVLSLRILPYNQRWRHCSWYIDQIQYFSF